MKVLLFHPVRLPALQYGGTERVVLWLAKGLAELGHEVWIAALEGSQLPPYARLLGVSAQARSFEDVMPRVDESFDLIHFMAPPSQHEIECLDRPYLVTVHGNGKAGEVFPAQSVFLSRNHAQRHHSDAFVWNGIDPEEYTFDSTKRESSFLFFSKTSWKVKNLAASMRHCRKAGVPLWIAGGQRPLVQHAISYLIPGFRWFGPVSGDVKSRLLSRTRALLFPVQWEEPFGLVVAEALMSGTPVLAARRGSLTELVNPGVGALLDDHDESWIEWLNRDRLPWSPESCREWAYKNFHYRRMADDYVKMYARVIKGEKINTAAPYVSAEVLS